MLRAYRGQAVDRPPVAPEFWYYYPARIMGVDMITLIRDVPFHLALKTTFEKFGCEGWGAAYPGVPNPDVTVDTHCEKTEGDRLLVTAETRTPLGNLTESTLYDPVEPAWAFERPIKDLGRDLPVFEAVTLGGLMDEADFDAMLRAHREVGESYLLEAWLGMPFFDYYAGAREGGFEAAVYDFIEHEDRLLALRERYIEQRTQLAAALCERTTFETFGIGCSWSCNSLIGPDMWRRWDKPVIQALADTVHRYGRLLHIHFHGRCLETAADFAAIGIDCVCPFERPPGGDVDGIEGLRRVRRLLAGRTTMNGNVHTVDTLIRGKPEDVRREVREVLEAFEGESRLIVGTGDQVGRETPEENIRAMIDAVKENQG